MHLFIYGPPGSGKSTIGRILAARLGRSFVDLDAVIEASTRQSIRDIFALEGERGFRLREQKALREAAADVTPCVISLGGGALLDPDNRALAEASGEIVFLQADVATLEGRVAKRPGVRPLLSTAGTGECKTPPAAGSGKPVAQLLSERAEHYGSFPNRVMVSDIPPESTADAVQAVLGWYRVSGMGNAYDIHVVADGFARLQNWLEPLAIGQKTVIVGDAHTLPLYGSRVKAVLEAMGVQASLVMLPAGEAHKTIDAVRQLWNAFLQAGIERKNVVFALGGGVVGDLTGFAAATWLRGIRWVNLPTTLLSMVDAGIGGKTGADLPEGKNLIGAFHPPALVVSDTSTLTSLPLHEWRNGLAEAIKHAIIGDPALLTYMPAFSAFLKQGESLALTPRACAAFVAQAMAVKVRIIQQDPFEKGIRAALNLGHTIGHAIEQVTHFGVSHGEAVAIGTVQEARLAEEIGSAEAGLAARIEALFSSVGLPTALPIGLSVPALKEAMSVDKKKADGLVRFALPVAVGEVRINQVISDHMLGVLVHVQQREA
jgi:3-dehydroquinate synthase